MQLLRRHAGLLLLAGILGLGLWISVWQPVSIDTLFAWGERLTVHPLAVVLIILAKALLYTFALPGSTLIWLIAPFQPPWIAVPVLVCGSLLGALGARYFVHRLSGNWTPGKTTGQITALLARRSDILTQTALRALPGFPHSVVNYAGGVLRLPLPPYIAAILIGHGCKWSVYASAIFGAGAVIHEDASLSAWTLLPLFVLAGLLLLAAWLRPILMKSE